MQLKIREDDWSIQLTCPEAPMFFVRLEYPLQTSNTLTFSDFSNSASERPLVYEALSVIEQRVQKFTHGTKLIFRDIYPISFDALPKAEIVSTHDQIVETVQSFISNSALTIEKSFLEINGSKFNTIILL